jgi:hypothetical protein
VNLVCLRVSEGGEPGGTWCLMSLDCLRSNAR